ncbi:MAG: phosphoglycerate dehydrogenase [Alphaproteobacteria bacterium]|nr:phosphoglycerate dehydrogenase [Alphaproteobacteria bacterium]MBV9967793.1 phosphoglycerate dehydrogenase [Alphaproteobacteria bacterium]
MPRVLITDGLSPRAVEIFAQRGVTADVTTGLAAAELKQRIAGYDGLAVRSATKVTAELLAAAPGLKVIGRAGIGVDNIDVAAATERGIVVMNTPYGNSITAAEHTIAMMFALARQIPLADRSTQAGKWEKSRFLGVELSGKTLGIIGCGNIGAIVADRALGLRMKVIAYDPFLSAERAVDLGVERVGFDELLARADFITLHTPLTDATRNIINAAAIAKTKPGVRLINCARGGLVVEADLAAALDSGQVAGAAFDVFVEEPARDNPLFGHANFIATPHLGAATAEAQENVAVEIAEQIADFLLTGAVSNAVNMPSLTAEEAARLKPYMTLAEQIGSFAGQLTETGIRAVAIDYEGAIAELNTKPLTAIALTGLLAPQLTTVNMVNAPLICRQRDIRVSETRRGEAGDYQTLMRITVTTERRRRGVAGTVFAGNKPRLVDIEGIRLEAELGRHMLFVRNKDKPGFIGALGNTLGAAQINIATFHLGRTAPGEDAIALVEIDQPMTPELIEAVRRLPNVIQAKAMRF